MNSTKRDYCTKNGLIVPRLASALSFFGSKMSPKDDPGANKKHQSQGVVC